MLSTTSTVHSNEPYSTLKSSTGLGDTGSSIDILGPTFTCKLCVTQFSFAKNFLAKANILQESSLGKEFFATSSKEGCLISYHLDALLFEIIN